MRWLFCWALCLLGARVISSAFETMHETRAEDVVSLRYAVLDGNELCLSTRVSVYPAPSNGVYVAGGCAAGFVRFECSPVYGIKWPECWPVGKEEE